MMNETPDLRSLVKRLEKVERQNRRLKQAGVMALIAVGVILLMGQATPKNRTVEAQAFILRDAEGVVRAELKMTPGGSSLLLKSSKGSSAIDLGVIDGMPTFFMFDRENAPPVVTLMANRSLNNRAILELNGLQGNSGVLLVVEQGRSGLQLTDAEGFGSALGRGEINLPITGESSKTSAASLVMFGKDGRVIWRAP